MYPIIELFGIQIHIFGITIAVCFFAFLWMLKKLSTRFSYDNHIFLDNLLWLFLGAFVSSRIFYVISMWQDIEYIRNPFQFFISGEYNFSLIGALLGFMSVLWILVRKRGEKMIDYLDGLVLSFVFVLSIGYIGALFGGQVYGIPTELGIELNYTNALSPVDSSTGVFPLPIVYALSFFILFSFLYIFSLLRKVSGLTGYIGLIIFFSLLLIFEFFSGKIDLFENELGINFNQFVSIFAIMILGYHGYKKFIKKA